MVTFRHIASLLLIGLITCCSNLVIGAETSHRKPLHVLLSTELQPLELRSGSVSGASQTSATSVKQSKTIQGTAFWQSFLVPGLGQLATGRRAAGYAFLTTEAGLIGGLVGLRIYAGRLEDNYRLYAGQHAGIATEKEHQFYVDLGNWIDVRSYNEARLRDRSFDAMYTDPGDAWKWDSDESRAHFKTMRIASDEARGKALLLVGGLVLNHLFSAVDAARGATKQYDVGYSPLPEGGWKLALAYRMF